MLRIPSTAEVVGEMERNEQNPRKRPTRAKQIVGRMSDVDRYSIFRTRTCPVHMPRKVAVAAASPMKLSYILYLQQRDIFIIIFIWSFLYRDEHY